jgi:hypothetical protein
VAVVVETVPRAAAVAVAVKAGEDFGLPRER